MLYFQEVHAQHRAVSAMLMFGLRIKIKAGSVSALELYKSLTSPIPYIRVQWAMIAMVARLNASLQSLAGWGASDGLRFELLRLAFENTVLVRPVCSNLQGLQGPCNPWIFKWFQWVRPVPIGRSPRRRHPAHSSRLAEVPRAMQQVACQTCTPSSNRL